MAELDKFARTRAKDPAQEQLRGHKQDWNDVASLLIAKLIAFKRGINGSGDARAEIPPSRITEELPQELNTYLNSIISDYSNLINGAKFIINEQKDYSASRKKASDDEPDLTAEASSALSRAWARVGLIGVPQYSTRIDILNLSSDIIPDLYNIENELTSRDKSGPARAVYDMVNLLEIVNVGIKPLIDSLFNTTEKDQPKPLAPEEAPEEAPERVFISAGNPRPSAITS